MIFASALPGHWRKNAEEMLHGKTLETKTKFLLFHWNNIFTHRYLHSLGLIRPTIHF